MRRRAFNACVFGLLQCSDEILSVPSSIVLKGPELGSVPNDTTQSSREQSTVSLYASFIDFSNSIHLSTLTAHTTLTMASVTVTESASAEVGNIGLTGGARMKCDGTDPSYGDWRDDLVRDGYAVVK